MKTNSIKLLVTALLLSLSLFTNYSLASNNSISESENNIVLDASSTSLLTESTSTNGFKMKAYRIGGLRGRDMDIVVFLKSMGTNVLVTVKFDYEADKPNANEYLATKNPKYKQVNPNADRSFIQSSDFNYIFTSEHGNVWGFLLEL